MVTLVLPTNADFDGVDLSGDSSGKRSLRRTPDVECYVSTVD